MFVSDLELGVPSDEDDLIRKLEANKIISSNLAKTVKAMKGCRNILVHQYRIVDNGQVFKFMEENLELFINNSST